MSCTVSLANGPFTSMGVGNSSCAEILRWSPTDQNDSGDMISSWADGYLRGINMAHVWWEQVLLGKNKQAELVEEAGAYTRHDLSAASVSEQLAFMLKYCSQNPLKPLSEAAKALYRELPIIPDTIVPAH